jgi:uncharacterized membrane protein
MDKDISKLIKSEADQLTKLQGIVQQSIAEEKLIIDNLLNPPSEILSSGDKISDKVAKFGGSWRFIISFLVVLILWIIYNSIVSENLKFDVFPFILLNLILSCIAALQAPIIMMSQNRQEDKDRKRSENDYMINLKSELEIRGLHQKIDLLLQEQIKILFDSQAKQLEILKSIEARLSK